VREFEKSQLGQVSFGRNLIHIGRVDGEELQVVHVVDAFRNGHGLIRAHHERTLDPQHQQQRQLSQHVFYIRAIYHAVTNDERLCEPKEG
jgi:hypothetical protein